MKKRQLQGLADNLCQMAVSERAEAGLEVLSDLPDGEVVLNLLEDSTSHSLAGALSFPFTAELRLWLEKRLAGSSLKLDSATVEMSYRTDTVPTDRQRIVLFLLSAQSTISADGRTWRGKARANSVWYRRAAVDPWRTDSRPRNGK